jgi:hypothetical protein
MIVERIPRWVKDYAVQRDALPAVSLGDPVVLTLAPANAAGRLVAKPFSRPAYDEDPDACWRALVAHHRDHASGSSEA